jgi:hypothetical protein
VENRRSRAHRGNIAQQAGIGEHKRAHLSLRQEGHGHRHGEGGEHGSTEVSAKGVCAESGWRSGARSSTTCSSGGGQTRAICAGTGAADFESTQGVGASQLVSARSPKNRSDVILVRDLKSAVYGAAN